MWLFFFSVSSSFDCPSLFHSSIWCLEANDKEKSNLETFLYYFNITGVHKKDICFYLSSGWFFFSRFFSCFSWSSWHVKISFYNCHLKVFRAGRIVHCIKKKQFLQKKQSKLAKKQRWHWGKKLFNVGGEVQAVRWRRRRWARKPWKSACQ